MPTVRFTLRKPKERKPQPIYLVFRYQNEKLVYGTGFSVLPKYWSFDKQRIRNVTDVPEKDQVNIALDDMATQLIRVYTQRRAERQSISKEILKNELDYYLGKEKRPEGERLFPFIKRYIKDSALSKSHSTLKKYGTAFNHLKAYRKARKEDLSFNDIDKDFYNDFVAYLTHEKDLAVNSVGSTIKNLKVFLRAAHEEGITQNRIYDHSWFKVMTEETDHIYLTENEIDQLYEANLSDSPRLERVRDLFVVGCWTGLRFSDLGKVSKDNLHGDKLQITQQKTGSKVAVPLHHIVREIISKYDGALPKPISNQKMNEYLKEIGERVGLDGSVSKSITKGGVKRITTFKKYELLSTHSARRSFATNQFRKGLSSHVIMKVTGHKSEKAFLKYIKLTPEENAEIMAARWREIEPMRKVSK